MTGLVDKSRMWFRFQFFLAQLFAETGHVHANAGNSSPDRWNSLVPQKPAQKYGVIFTHCEDQLQLLKGNLGPVSQQQRVVGAAEQSGVLRQPDLEETGFYQNQLIVLR